MLIELRSSGRSLGRMGPASRPDRTVPIRSTVAASLGHGGIVRWTPARRSSSRAPNRRGLLRCCGSGVLRVRTDPIYGSRRRGLAISRQCHPGAASG